MLKACCIGSCAVDLACVRIDSAGGVATIEVRWTLAGGSASSDRRGLDLDSRLPLDGGACDGGACDGGGWLEGSRMVSLDVLRYSLNEPLRWCLISGAAPGFSSCKFCEAGCVPFSGAKGGGVEVAEVGAVEIAMPIEVTDEAAEDVAWP